MTFKCSYICIRITVCIVVQFIPVDQPQTKQRAYRDWSLSRCFSSGSVVACWLEFPLLYRLQLCESTHLLPAGYPEHILIIRKKRGNTRWISPNLRNTTGFNPHAKTTWQKEIYSSDTQTWALAIGVMYGRIHFNIHCTAVKALLTLHLHMLCIYCKNIIQGTLLQETEE